MNLNSLIKSRTWLDIEAVLFKLYPDQEKSRIGYRRAFESFQNLEPKKEEMLIVISEFDDDMESIEEGTFMHVSGVEPASSSDSNAESYSLIALKWENWLGMEISPETVNNFTELEIIAHCLFDMTYFGFDQKQIKKELEEMDKSVEELENMTEEERKENRMWLEEFFKSLDEDDDDGPEDKDDK